MKKDMGLTLIEKIWQEHEIINRDDGNSLIYIDRIFLHERTGSIALKNLEYANRTVRNPSHVFCTMDHIVDTFPGRGDETLMPSGKEFIISTRLSAKKTGINFFDLGDPNQGIVHVVSPEQGIALPGVTLVCPDSHTCTVGGLGALGWGIGSSECEHALSTSTLIIKKPKMMKVIFDGTLPFGVTAKDLILHLIQKFGAAGGTGYAVEFSGPVVENLEIEARLTLCNMAVEFGAWTGIVAPDAKTFEYIAQRPFAPQGLAYNKALAHWENLRSDTDAQFDEILTIDCSTMAPFVTWGTSPQHAIPIDKRIPNPAGETDSSAKQSMQRALQYMDLNPGTKMKDITIDAAFIGSCTNSRLSDLRAASAVLKDRKVASGVKAICVPGSSLVKQQAEEEGLDQIFKAAGFEWRESGCSMCFFAGGESFGEQQRVITTTNRNFENRQGKRTRSHLASPATVAASAVSGKLNDANSLGIG